MVRKPWHILLAILLLGAFLRIYRMADLAVFLADQASDSTAVFQMVHGKFTLLGPITSVGGFYNGPVVYYLMLPFYFILSGHPLAGTIFQTTLSVLTIPLLYVTGKRLRNETVGFLASFLFAVSPLMIDYSRAAFNSYPAVFFSTLILYLLLSFKNRVSFMRTFVLGLSIGFILQMHYLTISLLALSLLYPFVLNRKILSHRYFLLLFAGVFVGISPFLAFEVRHEFLNLNLFFKYIFSQRESLRSGFHAFEIWPRVTSSLMFGNVYVLGLIGFLTILGTTIYAYLKKKRSYENVAILLILFLIVEAVSLLYGRRLETHYVVSFHTSLFLLASLTLEYFSKSRYFLLGAATLFFVVNLFAWNLTQARHPVQDGLNIRDFTSAARIIKEEGQKNYNVAMDAQGDNRAMPLRYMLSFLGERPQTYEDYAGAETLFFIAEKTKPLRQMRMWEYTSFSPKKVEEKWEINDQYVLYLLGK